MRAGRRSLIIISYQLSLMTLQIRAAEVIFSVNITLEFTLFCSIFTSMTKEDVIFKIETKSEWSFTWKGLEYSLTYGVDNSGCDYILFGRTFEGEKYYSVKELFNKARIENHFFREMLEDL